MNTNKHLVLEHHTSSWMAADSTAQGVSEESETEADPIDVPVRQTQQAACGPAALSGPAAQQLGGLLPVGMLRSLLQDLPQVRLQALGMQKQRLWLPSKSQTFLSCFMAIQEQEWTSAKGTGRQEVETSLKP
ncbi:hypothetical protein Anapl_18784 [Anas platyrhynchos]|uniref:Uncharacterized protein n=1 Tax=Anas platyrhynchos TaxID=8839 RepID=R0JGR1_ANAPL|nr:hypothetical protein Anapl_18784 [Anas platyrhynchos]